MGCGASTQDRYGSVTEHAANMDVIDDSLVKQLWDNYDGKVSADGTLCMSEISTLLKDYAAEKRKVLKGKTDNQKGIDEFASMVELGKNSDKYAEQMFKTMDRDKDGSVDLKEFQSKFASCLDKMIANIKKKQEKAGK